MTQDLTEKLTSSEQDHHPGGKHWTTARERLLLLTLAAIQFTTIVDFLIIIPLGPQYMEVFGINTKQFQWIVGSSLSVLCVW